MKFSGKNIILYMCALIILAGGAAYWANDLNADPPLYVAGLGQSLSTDPAQYVYHARNKVLFDDFDPFDYPRWLVYQRSLTSVTAYFWFSIAGASLKQANMVGIMLSLGALLLFLLAVSRYHRPWVAVVLVLGYVLNMSLMVHGRLSYLENGLIFISALLFLVYTMWGHRLWGLCLSALLVAVAMLMGKLFGVLLLPALLLAEYFSGSEDRMRRIIFATASFAVGTAVLVTVLYGTDFSAVYGYFGEQSYGLRGFPKGLSTPWDFIEHMVSYGLKNRLFFLGIDLVLFLVAGGFLSTYLVAGKVKLDTLSPVTRLSMFAVPFIFMGLMPLNYSPIRYALFLIPHIMIFFFTLTDQMIAQPPSTPKKTGYVKFIALFLILWHALFLTTATLFFPNDTPTRALVWTACPAALLITYLIMYLLNKRKINLGRTALYVILAVAVLASVLINASRIKTRVEFTTSYTIREANEDLSKIIGEGAVISGSYAPALTIDNDHKSFIHLFGVAEVDHTLFRKYPITHLAIDSSNWLEAVKNYPALKDMIPITAYWIRDYMVKIANVSEAFGNPQAGRYQKTGYEKAVDYYTSGKYDSALVEIGNFLTLEPGCRSANLFLADLLVNAGRYEQAARILHDLAARYPTDYYTNLICGRSYQIMGILQKNNQYMMLAREYYNRAVQNNPFRDAHARAMYQQIKQQFTPRAPSGGG